MSPENGGGAPANTGGASGGTGGAVGGNGGAVGGTGARHTDGGSSGAAPGGTGGIGGSGGTGSIPIDSGPPSTDFRWQALLQINGVAWGKGVYVAVGLDHDDPEDTTATAAMYWSTDGFDWNPSTVTLPAPATDVAYGNGAFVAISPGESATRVYRSEDGKAWTVTEIPGAMPRTGQALAFGNGVFVAALGDRVVRSSDGKNWQSASHEPLQGIEFGAGTFVAWTSATQFESSKTGVDWALSEPIRGNVQYNSVNLFGGEAGFDGILRYSCCFGEVPPTLATIHSDNGAVWKVTQGTATAPVLQEPGVCVTFSQSQALGGGWFSVGTSCDSATGLPTDEGFSPTLMRHEGPAYLFAGYAGIYASKDGLNYEPTLIHSQKIFY